MSHASYILILTVPSQEICHSCAVHYSKSNQVFCRTGITNPNERNQTQEVTRTADHVRAYALLPTWHVQNKRPLRYSLSFSRPHSSQTIHQRPCQHVKTMWQLHKKPRTSYLKQAVCGGALGSAPARRQAGRQIVYCPSVTHNNLIEL